MHQERRRRRRLQDSTRFGNRLCKCFMRREIDSTHLPQAPLSYSELMKVRINKPTEQNRKVHLQGKITACLTFVVLLKGKELC